MDGWDGLRGRGGKAGGGGVIAGRHRLPRRWRRVGEAGAPRDQAARIKRPDAGGRPRPDLPEGTDLLPQIRHIVVLMMENHSYDNYLGMLAGRGEGLPLGPDGTPDVVNYTPNGRGYPAHHMTSTAPGRRTTPARTGGPAISSTRTGATTASPPPWPRRCPAPTRPCRWATGPRRTCPSTTGSRGRSRWPTAGSAPAWARRSRTAGSSSRAPPTGSWTTCPGTSSTTRRPGRSSTCSPGTTSTGSTTTTCGTTPCCCAGCSAAAG